MLPAELQGSYPRRGEEVSSPGVQEPVIFRAAAEEAENFLSLCRQRLPGWKSL